MAWGKIRATLCFDADDDDNIGSEDDLWVLAEVEAAGQGWDYARIPYDYDPANGIWDDWPKGDGTDTDDTDATPGGANTGDGFSREEEYRGFSIGGTWSDTDPTQKDLFIRDVDMLGPGYATNLGFEIHFIDTYEWSGADNYSGYINRYGDNDQRGICIYDGGDDPEAYGATYPGVGTPNQCNYIEIYTAKIAEDYPDVYYEALDSTIGHEIGHDVDIEGDHPEITPCVMDTPIDEENPQSTYCDTCLSERRLH